MPVALAVRPADRLGVVRMTGLVTGDEIVTAAAELAARPDWEPAYRVIWDGAGIVELDVPPESFEALLAQERRLRERGERGELVFVLADEVWGSLVTLFSRKMRAEARAMSVVPTREAAFAYFGVTPD